MKVYLLTLISVIIFSCGSDNNPTIISVGKTHKVTSNEIYNSEYGISYFWSKPEGPENHKSSWVINDNSVLFTPKVAGEYKLALSVETTTGKVLGVEKFDLLAIDDSSAKKIKKNIEIANENEKNETPKREILNKKYELGYSIQVSSWDNKKIAELQKLKLTDLGYNNSYVIRKKINNFETKWRVRIGPYKSIAKAKDIEKLLNELSYTSFISEVKYIK